jgi:pimeloyl-ACP methyl ester carboxylesterase
VDFINLHSNAGTSSGDETARENEWAQLTSWIAANVPAGDALVVAGDTNSRYTRTLDDLQSFVASNGLTDAWEAARKGYFAGLEPDVPAVKAALRKLTAPVLLYAGDRDPLVTPAMVSAAAPFFNAATVTIQPHAGHFPWIDDPAAFAAAIEAFLAQWRRQGRLPAPGPSAENRGGQPP